MIRTLIKWALIAIIAILTYNYFFGTEEEQRQSRKIAGTAKEMVSNIYQFIKDETARIQDGKYDDVVQNIRKKIDELKEKGGAAKEQLENIEAKLESAQEKINEYNNSSKDSSEKMKDTIEKELNDILNRLDKVSDH